MNEFFEALLGPLNEVRTKLVEESFQKLDANGNGTLEFDEVKKKFDPSRHPDVKNGDKTVEECRYEFYDMFQTHHNVEQNFAADRSVTYDEFLSYHRFVNCAFEHDRLFKIFMTGVWNLDLMDVQGSRLKTAGLVPEVYGKNSRE